MKGDEHYDACIDIISEIKLITGVSTYDDSMERDAQIKVIQRFLYGFGNFTKEEVVHAFYLNSQGVYSEVYRHYNKSLNAEFIGDVLRAYIRYKRYILDVKGPQLSKILQIGPSKEIRREIDYSFWKQLIQSEYEQFRKTRPSGQLWHQRKYYTLRKFGLLPFPKGFQTWLYFFKKVMKGNTAGTKLPNDCNIEHYHFANLAECRAIFHSDADFKRCLDHLRKSAYWYILNSCRECGINDLFSDIENCIKNGATCKCT